jgi:hypothetical protein
MKRTGQSWGAGRPKYPQEAVDRAMQLRADGMKLQGISAATGLSVSYISRLGRFAEQGKGRSGGVSNSLLLTTLKARQKKLKRRLNEINRQIREIKNGKQVDPSKGTMGPDKTAGAAEVDRRPLRLLRAPAPGSAGVAGRPPTGEGVDSIDHESGGPG